MMVIRIIDFILKKSLSLFWYRSSLGFFFPKTNMADFKMIRKYKYVLIYEHSFKNGVPFLTSCMYEEVITISVSNIFKQSHHIFRNT